MNEQNYIIVTSVNGVLQAISVQNALETAGIPAIIRTGHDGPGMDVLVPAGSLSEVQGLLAPEPRSGEIFCVPGRASKA